MLPILMPLLANGLSLIGNAIMAKGQAYIEEKTGVKLDNPNLTGEQIATLKKYEMEHEEELLKLRLEEDKLNIEAYKISVEDRESARAEESKIQDSANASSLAKNTKSILALGTVALCFAGFYLIFDTPLDQAKKELAMLMIGYLAAFTQQIYAYYFGDSDKVKVQNLGAVK